MLHLVLATLSQSKGLTSSLIIDIIDMNNVDDFVDIIEGKMANLLPILKSIGLTENQAKVYLAGLELGPASILDLARVSGVKRTTIYSVMEELLAQDFFTTLKKEGKKLYAAIDPDSLKHMILERHETLTHNLPEFRALYSLSPSKPKVIFYEGAENIKKIMEEPLHILSKGQLYYRINAGQKEMVEVVGQDWWKDLAIKRVKKGLPIKVIADRISQPIPELVTTDPKALREIRFLPTNTHIPVREQIYGDRMAIIDLRAMIALVIEDKNVADLHRVFFEALWDKCKG